MALSWIGAGLAILLAVASAFRPRHGVVRWTFSAGLLLLGLDAIWSGFSYEAATAADVLFWQRVRLQTLSFLPSVWLTFSLAYSRGNYQEFLRRWLPVCLVFLVVPPALAFGFRGDLLTSARMGDAASQWHLGMGWAGMALSVVLILGAVLMLTNLERTFRASVGTMRWRIKFMVLGLVVLFAVRFYINSQCLIASSINVWLTGVNVIALILAIALIMISVLRVGLYSQDVYPSQTFLQFSLTGLLAGLYLVAVGLLAKLVSIWGGAASFHLNAFLILISLVGLTVLLLSERMRQHIRRFISRHFDRPYYDYRRIWLTLTERTKSVPDREGFCRAIVKWVSDTFNILSVNLWSLDEGRGQLTLSASSSIDDVASVSNLPIDEDMGRFIEEMQRKPLPVQLEENDHTWNKSLETLNPQFFGSTFERVCVPLVAGDKFLGAMTLTDRVSKQPFTVEDLDLLTCVGEQVAASFLNFQLSERLLQVKEMEAFQLMSAFFVHDLKNTASTLSLMLKNMTDHYDNPEFREDALRGLGTSVGRINELIGRLGLIREAVDMNKQPSDLNEVVQAAVKALGDRPTIEVKRDLGKLPRIQVDPEQIRKVVSNLLVNAVDATGKAGEITIRTEVKLGWVVLSVTDDGCGMDPDFLSKSLFRPFQSTKNKGIGIGMFLSKRIVEAHGGKMEVESELGRGTTFRLLLPRKESKL